MWAKEEECEQVRRGQGTGSDYHHSPPPSKKRLKRLMWHCETQHQQGPRSHGTMGERGEHLVQGIQVGIFAKCWPLGEGECECDSWMQDRREKFWGRLVIFSVEIKNGEWAVGWVFKGRFTGEADELNENWWVILVNIRHFSHETGETN